jgi:hypothetical protein
MKRSKTDRTKGEIRSLACRPSYKDDKMASPMANNEVRVEMTGFDIISQDDVKLAKVGTCEPVADAGGFAGRLGNDSALMLRMMNKALEFYAQEQLASDPAIEWKLVEEDDDGKEVLTPFAGQLINPEKAKELKPTQIQFAKMLFGYKKWMVAGDKKNADVIKANAAAKKTAKDLALQELLKNPAIVERLKSAE